MNFPADPEHHRLRRERVLRQLQRVSARLEVLLAGQDGGIADVELPQDKRPGETPLERLQRFRARLGVVLIGIDEGQVPACEDCRVEIPNLELDETPWATRCRRCSG